MNILFISISSLPHLSEHSISLDLIRRFRENGHNMYVLSSLNRRDGSETYLTEEENCKIVRVKIGKNKKAGLITKGLTTLSIPKIYISAIKKYYSDIKFDLVMYPTPPITFAKVVEFVKKRDVAKSYLLLKDIFPQNAVDIGMMNKSGLKGFIYRHFRKVEKKLYKLSDYIGGMSEANREYILKHNPEISADKVEICPNSIEVLDTIVSLSERDDIRSKYGIPLDKKVFVYGGNLSKPQGIPFIIECLKRVQNHTNAYFVIVGDGTDFPKLERYIAENNPCNIKLMKKLPKRDYERLVAACDVGMIFLDHRFTIPNFPSRLLSYMQSKMPVLACTDPNTDVGKVITEGGFGWWCESNDAEKFMAVVDLALRENLQSMGQKGYEYLLEHYTVETAYNIIMARVEKKETEPVI